MCKMVESIDKKDKISIMVNICIESIQTLEFNWKHRLTHYKTTR